MAGMNVPYTPVPSQTLEPIATPEINPRIPAAAFGGEAAQALSGFGKTVEGAGNDIFNKAVALQNLANEAEAKNAASDYQIQAGKLHAEYSSLQGKAAVDGFEPYTQKLKALREQMRGGLKTGMSQKDFDSDSLSTMGRTIFNGAGHAATQNKQYVAGASAARVDSAGDSVFADPSEVNFKQSVATATREIRETQAPLAGWSPEKTEETVKQKVSELTLKRLVGMSRSAPFQAKDMLNAEKANMTTEDYLKADQIVRSQSRSVGSANIAQEIYQAGQGNDETPAKPLSQMQAEARAKAKAFDPDDPLLESHTIAALNGIANQDKYARKQEEAQNLEIVNGAIANGVKTEQDLRADPKVAAAVDALPKNQRLALPSRINSYNAAKGKVANEEKFNTLMGMSNNDVEGFLDTDPYATGLSQSQMDKIASRQQLLKKNQNQDPRVDRAINWLKQGFAAQMTALGIDKRTKDNKDNYDNMTGAVQSALDLWMENHGKPPSYPEFKEKIAPEILNTHAAPTWGFGLFGGGKQPFYNQDTDTKEYKEFTEDTKAKIIAKGGGEPSEQDLYAAYVRTQLMKLYPSSKKSKVP